MSRFLDPPKAGKPLAEDKVDKTGISYEPWHYRYVGRYHAQKMYEMGLCLEEYCEYLGIK